MYRDVVFGLQLLSTSSLIDVAPGITARLVHAQVVRGPKLLTSGEATARVQGTCRELARGADAVLPGRAVGSIVFTE